MGPILIHVLHRSHHCRVDIYNVILKKIFFYNAAPQ
jgi:hypothetical protein